MIAALTAKLGQTFPALTHKIIAISGLVSAYH
jgi:hypothetical protein